MAGNASRAAWRLIPRRLVLAIAWGIAIILAAGIVNAIGIRIVGNVDGWSRWLDDHRTGFLLWRLCLYAATAWGWWRMRERVRVSQPDARIRLRRVEIAAVIVVLVLEVLADLRP